MNPQYWLYDKTSLGSLLPYYIFTYMSSILQSSQPKRKAENKANLPEKVFNCLRLLTNCFNLSQLSMQYFYIIIRACFSLSKSRHKNSRHEEINADTHSSVATVDRKIRLRPMMHELIKVLMINDKKGSVIQKHKRYSSY